ncbi:uncharacterized protein FTOL_12953 [Fusarium torulosum]|uniref:Transmembrane protein n=1 Tax=Fusarium torulosum TaxID=33205 RepID=A0AAE8ML83_9HYPO|nr:uncharacterized protein FTOL_12953 [Fusarium torulosum]
MPVANPVTSSQPETQIPGSRPMGGLEIGLMAGSIVFFVVLISSIFIVRGLDQRRRVKEMLRRAEEGNAGVKGEFQTPQENNISGQDQHEAAKHHLWGKLGANLKTYLYRLKANQEKVGNVSEASSNTKAGQTN